MEAREYVTVRRAYGLVRQRSGAESRITFEELAILCHLANARRELKTSDIAAYQGVLRPTMTHRTNHLAVLGLITRREGEVDRRNVCCGLSDDGSRAIVRLTTAICSRIPEGDSLFGCTAAKMRRVVDAMGGVSCASGDLVLVGLLLGVQDGVEALAISRLVSNLGLLQPTVSMAVAQLREQGLVERQSVSGASRRGARVVLTEEGMARAEDLSCAIQALEVPAAKRGRRKTKGIML